MTQITNDMKTDWFPVIVKPVRAGVYQVEKSYGVAWAHWDGRTWSHGSRDVVLTDPVIDQLACFHNYYAAPVMRWRGLVREV